MVKPITKKRVNVIAVKDCFTKEIIACKTSRKQTASEIKKVVYPALANRNLKEFPIEELYVTSDNGKGMDLQKKRDIISDIISIDLKFFELNKLIKKSLAPPYFPTRSRGQYHRRWRA